MVASGANRNGLIYTYVTITTPLLRTHERITCVGEAPSRLAACSTGASTGPPGYLVIGLEIWVNGTQVNKNDAALQRVMLM